MTQQMLFTVYRPRNINLCRKQTEVCRFHFAFAANKQKLPFSVNSVFRIYIYKWQQLYRYILHVFWNSKCWLPFIVWRPRKTNFCVPFAGNKEKFAVSILCQFCFPCLYILKRRHIYWYWYFIPTHSLTGPVGQPFASRLGGQRFMSQGCTNSQ